VEGSLEYVNEPSAASQEGIGTLEFVVFYVHSVSAIVFGF
jgi:hypothetical protein